MGAQAVFYLCVSGFPVHCQSSEAVLSLRIPFGPFVEVLRSYVANFFDYLQRLYATDRLFQPLFSFNSNFQ